MCCYKLTWQAEVGTPLSLIVSQCNQTVTYSLFQHSYLRFYVELSAPCTTDAVSFMYSDDKLSWFEAQNKCRDINGNLFDPHLSNIRRLQKSCGGEVPGAVWSGHYHALSHWIEFVGIYAMPSSISDRTMKTRRLNHN